MMKDEVEMMLQETTDLQWWGFSEIVFHLLFNYRYIILMFALTAGSSIFDVGG